MRAADCLVLPVSRVHTKLDLDSLLSAAEPSKPVAKEAVASHPFAAALGKAANMTRTANGAPAFKSTEDPCLDIFSELSSAGTSLKGEELASKLEDAWNSDPACTLRLIFYARSIVDGAGERLLFFRCAAWLLDRHPLSLIGNLHILIENVGPSKEVLRTEDDVVELIQRPGRLHGSYKDLLNVALVSLKKLDSSLELTDLLAAPKLLKKRKRDHDETVARKRTKAEGSTEVVAAEVAATAVSCRAFSAAAGNDVRESVVQRLEADAIARAVYFTVANLFATRLRADEASLTSDDAALRETIGYAAKWAPTEKKSVDRQTCLASTIAQRLYPGVSVALARRQYNRLLVRLRGFMAVPEQRMRRGDWKIEYAKVPAVAFRRNEGLFAKHDAENLTRHLQKVALGKATVAGAATSPAALVYDALSTAVPSIKMPRGLDHKARTELFEKLRELQVGRINGQWESLVRTLREEIDAAKQLVEDAALAAKAEGLSIGGNAKAGPSLEVRKAQALLQIQGSLAVCDVSGSMYGPTIDSTNTVAPIHAAMSLSLLLTELAAAPWNSHMMTFSEKPEIVKLDMKLRLVEQVQAMRKMGWGYSTRFDAVFDLLLWMAKEHKLARADTAIRIFVFSDMQFDVATSRHSTNFKAIKQKYDQAGYEMPHLIFWNLAAKTSAAKPVTAGTEHVTLLSGFSGAQLKAFLNGTADTALDDEDEDAAKDESKKEGEVVEGFEVVEDDVKDRMSTKTTPVQRMRRILGAESFKGITVYD